MLQAKKGKAVLRKGLTSTGVVLLLLSGACVTAQDTNDTLMKGFENPPQSARPRVWWHWMNGNITKEGIKLDLEWMHRIGTFLCDVAIHPVPPYARAGALRRILKALHQRVVSILSSYACSAEQQQNNAS